MEDDEEDYMSDKFINAIADTAPGLTTVRSIQRQRQVEVKSTQGRTLPRAVEEAKRREEGLEKKVEPTNKGFNMLLKMGYAPGRGLGKNAEGRAEPVPIEIRQDRSGLGRDAVERERREAIQRLRQQMVMAERNEFRGAMSFKFRLSRVKRQLTAAQRICLQLDTAQSIPVPVSATFWPPPEPRKSADDEEREPLRRYRSEHRGAQRSTHGTHEERERSPFYDDRDQLPELSDEEDLSSLEVDKQNSMETDVFTVLQDLVTYLRDRHLYCFWCSAHYANQSELDNECPGRNEEDHE